VNARSVNLFIVAGLMGLILLLRWVEFWLVYSSSAIDAWIATRSLLLLLLGCAGLGAWQMRGPDKSAQARSPYRLALRRFARNRLAVVGLYVIVGFCLVAILAPVLAPYDPAEINDPLATRYLAPSLSHLFGTDEFGRDLFSRAVYGARISLSVGVLAVLVAVTFGSVYGAVAAYFGGWVDSVLMRTVDVILAFPTFFLMLMLVGVFEASLLVLVLILGFTSWTGTARLIRGEILSLKELNYIEAARAMGLSHPPIIFWHLIPNAIVPVLVSAALMVGGMIGAEAGLSFLGIGIRPPTPSWGNMIGQGQDAMFIAWWVALFPGALLSVTILSFNLLADGLRDALDPKSLTDSFV
jgi:peptide/nickel transport system permease protein